MPLPGGPDMGIPLGCPCTAGPVGGRGAAPCGPSPGPSGEPTFSWPIVTPPAQAATATAMRITTQRAQSGRSAECGVEVTGLPPRKAEKRSGVRVTPWTLYVVSQSLAENTTEQRAYRQFSPELAAEQVLRLNRRIVASESSAKVAGAGGSPRRRHAPARRLQSRWTRDPSADVTLVSRRRTAGDVSRRSRALTIAQAAPRLGCCGAFGRQEPGFY